jgi:hypothetical protein
MKRALVAAALLLVLGACTTQKNAYLRNGAPEEGLSELLAGGPEPLHIVFLHGMRATESGGSAIFRAALCKRLPKCVEPKVERVRIALRQPGVTYLDKPIWGSAEEWAASAPIVYRYTYPNGARPPVVVEEIDWWPLLHPIKCRLLVRSDAPLTGASQDLLDLCSAQGRYADGEHHAWLTREQAAEVSRTAAVTGGGAKLNRALKIEIMDWGLSDAVIAAGPFSEVLGRGIGSALAWTAATPVEGAPPPTQGGRRYVLISESLGSFVALDYYARHYDQGQMLTADKQSSAPEEARAAYGLVQVIDNSDRLYFLANQVALLELSRLGVTNLGGLGDPIEPGLTRWIKAAGGSGAGLAEPRSRQLVAFHDPSDPLTFEVPADIKGAQVHNVFVVNGPTYLGLLADPARAHTAHSRNSCVLDIIFDKATSGPCKVAPQPK